MPPKNPKLSSLGEKLEKSFSLTPSRDVPRIFEIDLSHILPNPAQPRKFFDEDSLKELTDSIDTHGLIQPITVKKMDDGKYLLVAGERRFRAHQLLGKTHIYAVITSGNPDEIALIENIQREDLSPIEEAEALAKMMERHGYKQEELARIIGKARNTINAILRLNTLPEEIKQECPTSDTVSKSVLLEIAREESRERQLVLWEQAKQGKFTVKTARQAKKDGSTIKKTLPPTEQMLTVGRSFARKLEKTNPRDLSENRAQYEELLELCEKIQDLAKSLQGTIETK
jgi:ParB family transcriptional regulator, chromosome partitioning protein